MFTSKVEMKVMSQITVFLIRKIQISSDRVSERECVQECVSGGKLVTNVERGGRSGCRKGNSNNSSRNKTINHTKSLY